MSERARITNPLAVGSTIVLYLMVIVGVGCRSVWCVWVAYVQDEDDAGYGKRRDPSVCASTQVIDLHYPPSDGPDSNEMPGPTIALR